MLAYVPAESVVDVVRATVDAREPGDGKVFVLPATGGRQEPIGKRGREAVHPVKFDPNRSEPV